MLTSSLRFALFLAIPAFAVLAWLTPAHNLSAQAKKEPQTLSDEQLAASIVKLRSVKLTLEAADHDYGGHRAAAVEKIKSATHELHLALEHVRKGKIVPKGGKDVGSSNEPQKLSDAQLAATIPALKQTHKLLQKAEHDYGGHRAKAVTELGTAITQLEKALVDIKGKNP